MKQMAPIIYPLASSSWDERELAAAQRVLASGFCTMGPIVGQFEAEFAARFGSRFAVMSNSGSSANLLAVAALCFRRENGLRPGDEVIVPAVSWSTTYYPFQQYGLKLRFVDVNRDDFNIDLAQVERAIGPQTKAVCAVNLLGVPCRHRELQELCVRHKLLLFEDNCESLGATYASRECGTFGVIGTFSTFFSHHLCTIEGGMCLTDDEELFQIMRSLRAHGWLRDLPDNNHVCDKTGDALIDSFRFALPGYNLRPNELFAAIGLEQLAKLPSVLETRRRNHATFAALMEDLQARWPGVLSVQRHETDLAVPSWFGFGVVLDHATSRERRQMMRGLLARGIESRPIVAGNFVRNPVIAHIPHEIVGTLENADRLHHQGFFIGNHPTDISSQLHHFAATFDDLLTQTAVPLAA